jgi:hypothetical protein
MITASGISIFISEDPLGFDGGDVNLMAYSGNNPVMRVDPTGLWNIDANITGGPGWGGTAGIQIGSTGIFAYAGGGAATGAGASVTLNAGDPTPGVSGFVTYSGGTGTVGGFFGGDYPIYPHGPATQKLGLGWGVGSGVAGGVVTTVPVVEWGGNSGGKSNGNCQK